MSFSYKSYNIANEITQNDAIPTQVPGFNLDTTATNYVYQRPLPFGLTYQGNQISELSTAKRNIYYNSINLIIFIIVKIFIQQKIKHLIHYFLLVSLLLNGMLIKIPKKIII